VIHQHENARSGRNRRNRFEFRPFDDAGHTDQIAGDPPLPGRQHPLLPGRGHPHQRHDDQPLNEIGKHQKHAGGGDGQKAS
jgi:hypothetical protein